MKILIVHPTMNFYGGAEYLVVKLANFLTKNNIENTILTLEIAPEIKRELISTEIITIKEKSAIKKRLNLLQEIQLFNRYIKLHESKFDVINVHNLPVEDAVLGVKAPVVWMCNEPPEIWDSKISLFKKILYRIYMVLDVFIVRYNIKNVVVADEFNKKRFINRYGIIPTIINYGVDYPFFSKDVKNEGKLRFNSDGHFIISQVGMITKMKNQIESIKAIENLIKYVPNIKLILAGNDEGEYADYIKNYVNKNGLKEYVDIIGHVSRDEIRALYTISDVIIFPIKSQGGWLSPFEALCAGKPIIVSNEMTASDIIKQNQLGTVTNNFRDVIYDIYQNPGKYNKIGKHGKEWVKTELSWDKFSSKMVDEFKKAINTQM